MSIVSRKRSLPTALIDSYAQLAHALLGEVTGVCLLDAKLHPLGCSGSASDLRIAAWLKSLRWDQPGRKVTSAIAVRGTQWLSAIPITNADGARLGVLCVQQPQPGPRKPDRAYLESQLARLAPALDCLRRELDVGPRERTKIRTLSQRTAELEWLFKVTTSLHQSEDGHEVLDELLASATQRLGSIFGGLFIPEKNLGFEFTDPQAPAAAELAQVWQRTRGQLLGWMQRHRRPLVANRSSPAMERLMHGKIVAVPVIRETGRVIGILAFFRPPQAPDYSNQHSFLARHLGRHMAALVESQFDLMTGLYTRGGLEQVYARLLQSGDASERCVVYLDIDHMRVINETHGFEIGNEVIVRVAELLAVPLLPTNACAARGGGDRFLILLPSCDVQQAAEVAQRLQQAAAQLRVGREPGTIELSVSCGIASLVDMPQGLARAIAAAEIAVKAAKSRGRNRTELYACEDSTIMRQQDDVMAVAQLRRALRNDDLVLYAQPIVPLRPGSPACAGYEVLMRARAEDGTILSPGPLIDAASRYQLLPSVDRWVIQRALQMMAPYRRMIQGAGMTLSINVSAQSIGDPTFIDMVCEQLRAANLAPGIVIIEVTEQAAVRNLARADHMVERLRAVGCRIALDDFGTGMNSLTLFKHWEISRLKIDGSFIRDIVTNTRSQVAVRSIIELARGIHAETVAEYVETPAIAEAVRAMGIDYAQGYAFAQPTPLAGLLESLAHDESRRLRRLLLEL